MGTQLKKNSLNTQNLTLEHEKNFKRPNIDHLIKRIRAERRKERNTSILSMVSIIFGITIISFFFSKD
jgi:hypothetical protein